MERQEERARAGSADAPTASGQERRARVCVLAVTPLLTVTIEPRVDSGSPEVHIHPGGQGLWIARMAHCLGTDVVVCGPFGGETGTVASLLVEREELGLRCRP